MKVFICADIHGNLRALDAVLEVYKKAFPCAFLCLGDCIGYGPNPDLCLARIMNLPELELVMGNHEYTFLNKREMVQLNPIAAEALNWSESLLRGRFSELIAERFKMVIENESFLAVHASPINPVDWPYVYTTIDADEIFYHMDFRVCFYGHTHIPAMFSSKHGETQIEAGETVTLDPDDRYIVNPGSVGQPRDFDTRASCAVFDLQAGTIELFRCEYDVEAEAHEFYEKGLPRYLGERLLYGR